MMRSADLPTARQSQIINDIMQLARDFNAGRILFKPYCDQVDALWREYDGENPAREAENRRRSA